MSKVHLSPVWVVAAITASTALGLAEPAKAEDFVISPPSPPSTEQVGEVTDAVVVDSQVVEFGSPVPADAETDSTGVYTVPISSGVGDASIPNNGLSSPTAIGDPAIAPLPNPSPWETPGTPMEVAQDFDAPPEGTVTPDQETPDEIQFGRPAQDTPILEETLPGSPSPDTAPAPAPMPSAPSQAVPTTEAEPKVLVAEVLVSGVESGLADEVYQAIQTRAGETTTRSRLQEDINAVFATGYFAKVRAVPEDTPLGVRVTFLVEANPVLREVRVDHATALPPEVIQEAFSPQYGTTLNLRDLQDGIKKINTWYQDNGYVIAQVVDSPQISPDGTVTLVVAEGVIEDIQVQFLSKEGETTDEDGETVKGRTRPFIITREFELKPGDVFNRQQVEADLRRVFGLGIFEDVRLSLNPGQDPQKVVVVVNVIERNTGSIAAGAGVSSASGLFGSVSYQEQNLGGNNQKLGAELQVGEREILFDVNFTDPWIAGDPFRTSYTVNAFRRRSISLIFDGGENEVELENGDRPRVSRFGAGVDFTRPLDNGWRLSAGFQGQEVSIRDADGDLSPVDEEGNDLSFSGTGKDNLFTLQFGAALDRRNDAVQPTKGSLLRFGVEQSIPIGQGSILFNRLRASYSRYIPVEFLSFSKGPQALAFNVQGGTVFGDLPPYEAFSLGGSNSVRGYDEGDVGSGRSFVQATAEYRFPLFAVVGGALFVDFASDLGTASEVPGDPAGIRGKPGTGFGYGVGVRVKSPLGAIRVDYGLNDQGDSRIHFGIGERF